MIKVGIDGAGSPEAGELIRLLINHPDVELAQLCQPEYAGREMSDVHHGLIGEKRLPFIKSLDYEDLDLIFFTSGSGSKSIEDSDEFVNSKTSSDSGFAIYLSPTDEMLSAASPYFFRCTDDADSDIETERWSKTVMYGVPELNRKPLVRGSRKVVIPTALESISIVSLLPLLEKISLPKIVEIKVEAPSDLIDDYRLSKVYIEERISMALSELTGRSIDVNIVLNSDEDAGRSVSISTDVPAASTLDELRRTIEEAYDDHNLSHLSRKALSRMEVEGTDNCLIEINKTVDGTFRISAIADGRMRGGAGEAIHVMNLLGGLFEKTGLHLKASNF